jgi:hypothetical protein
VGVYCFLEHGLCYCGILLVYSEGDPEVILAKLLKQVGKRYQFNWKEISAATDDNFVKGVREWAASGPIVEMKLNDQGNHAAVYLKIGNSWHSFAYDRSSCTLIFCRRKNTAWKVHAEYRDLAAYREQRRGVVGRGGSA